MSSQVTTAFVQQYRAAVFHLSQQQGSLLRGAVRNESQHSKADFYDRIGTVSAQRKLTRHGDTPQMDTPHSRRKVTLEDYEWADLVDSADKLRMLMDPTGEYAKAAAMSFGRTMDDVLIAAALGDAYTGETGSSTQALGTGQRVVAHTAGTISGLNTYALRKASYLLNSGNVDPRIQRYCAINAKMLDSLLSETAVQSSDYNTVKALVNGEIDTWLGFKFIRTEQLVAPSVAFSFDSTTGLYNSGGTAVTLSTSKSAICWAQDGLLLSIGQDMKAEIGPRADKSYSTQVYASMSIGATRMEEAKVVEIITAA
jgi:hypothetical protein